MDNASYHSRFKEEKPKKLDQVQYGTSFDSNDTKSQLFSIIQEAAERMGLSNTKYTVDEIVL